MLYNIHVNKMKKKTYLSVRVVPKSRRKITETDAKKKKCACTHLHNHTLSSLQQTTSTGLKLALRDQVSALSEMMRACKNFQQGSKIPTITYNWTSNIIRKSDELKS